MAERPIFVPVLSGSKLVRTWDISFEWYPGMAVKQAQKSIDSLHASAKQRIAVDKVLEISSKSKDPRGVKLSAFNLMINTKRYNQTFSVECAYQSAKVFEHGGPYKDLRERTSREAKLDPRLKASGRLLKFQFFDVEWGLEPKSAFYDWLYINALHNAPDLADYVLEHRAFSDIAFNPEKSLNCQAYSAALYVALHERGLLTDSVLRRKESYLDALKGLSSEAVPEDVEEKPPQVQPDMFNGEQTPEKASSPAKLARIARDQLPAHWPTHRHPPEFWEQLGRTIAAFGFLEEVMGKAIFAFTATTEYAEEQVEKVLAQWPDQLQRALTDPIYPLAEVYGKVVRAHQESDFANVDELVNDIKEAANLRNALCHGSWGVPGADGGSPLHYVSKRDGKFGHVIDTTFLRQLEARVVNMACTVIDSVTMVGWQFPGGAGPGREIWSK